MCRKLSMCGVAEFQSMLSQGAAGCVFRLYLCSLEMPLPLGFIIVRQLFLRRKKTVFVFQKLDAFDPRFKKASGEEKGSKPGRLLFSVWPILPSCRNPPTQ